MVHRGRSQATQAAHTRSRQMRLYTGREAVRVDVGPYQHKALEHAERRVRTYGKALLGLASLLCLSVCGNLVCSALSILVFKESQFTDTIPQRPVGWIERFGDFYAHASLHVILPEDPDPPSPVPPPRPPHATKQEVENMFSWGYPLLSDSGLKSCAIALSGTEAWWELTDPAMTDIPEDFLHAVKLPRPVFQVAAEARIDVCEVVRRRHVLEVLVQLGALVSDWAARRIRAPAAARGRGRGKAWRQRRRRRWPWR